MTNDRKLVLISDTIGKLLVQQLQHELMNYNLYKEFSTRFAIQGVTALETYYAKRAEEEKHHADWIHTYLTDADYEFKYPEIPADDLNVTNTEDVFVKTIEREIETTNMIYDIFETAWEEKDFMTTTWLQKLLIPEQIEEENTSRMALAIMELDSPLLLKAKEVLKLLK